MAENDDIDEHETTAEPPDRAEDAALVERARTGDADAFGQLYDAWFDRIFELVSRVVRDPDIAEEVAQDAFFSAWRSLGTLEKPDAFGGWLLRIARNGAYNRQPEGAALHAVDDQGLAVIESVGASPTGGAPSGFGVEDRLGRAVTPGAAVEDAEIVSLVWRGRRGPARARRRGARPPAPPRPRRPPRSAR